MDEREITANDYRNMRIPFLALAPPNPDDTEMVKLYWGHYYLEYKEYVDGAIPPEDKKKEFEAALRKMNHVWLFTHKCG